MQQSSMIKRKTIERKRGQSAFLLPLLISVNTMPTLICVSQSIHDCNATGLTESKFKNTINGCEKNLHKAGTRNQYRISDKKNEINTQSSVK